MCTTENKISYGTLFIKNLDTIRSTSWTIPVDGVDCPDESLNNRLIHDYVDLADNKVTAQDFFKTSHFIRLSQRILNI